MLTTWLPMFQELVNSSTRYLDEEAANHYTAEITKRIRSETYNLDKLSELYKTR
jgi:hypothetical protein